MGIDLVKGKTYKKIDLNMKNTKKTVSPASGICIVDFPKVFLDFYTVKKRLMTFPSPAWMSLYKNSHPDVGRECRLHFYGVQAAEELSQRYPGRILLLRYEDLSIEPETTTRLGPTVLLHSYFLWHPELSPYTLKDSIALSWLLFDQMERIIFNSYVSICIRLIDKRSISRYCHFK